MYKRQQRGRIIILGDVGINLGDSMYDGTIFVGGEIGSYGSDAVDSELTSSDQEWLKRKLKVAEIGENFDVSKMKKIVAGKKLWNYDNLEPTEKKGAIYCLRKNLKKLKKMEKVLVEKLMSMRMKKVKEIKVY